MPVSQLWQLSVCFGADKVYADLAKICQAHQRRFAGIAKGRGTATPIWHYSDAALCGVPNKDIVS